MYSILFSKIAAPTYFLRNRVSPVGGGGAVCGGSGVGRAGDETTTDYNNNKNQTVGNAGMSLSMELMKEISPLKK